MITLRSVEFRVGFSTHKLVKSHLTFLFVKEYKNYSNILTARWHLSIPACNEHMKAITAKWNDEISKRPSKSENLCFKKLEYSCPDKIDQYKLKGLTLFNKNIHTDFPHSTVKWRRERNGCLKECTTLAVGKLYDVLQQLLIKLVIRILLNIYYRMFSNQLISYSINIKEKKMYNTLKVLYSLKVVVVVVVIVVKGQTHLYFDNFDYSSYLQVEYPL